MVYILSNKFVLYFRTISNTNVATKLIHTINNKAEYIDPLEFYIDGMYIIGLSPYTHVYAYALYAIQLGYNTLFNKYICYYPFADVFTHVLQSVNQMPEQVLQVG